MPQQFCRRLQVLTWPKLHNKPHEKNIPTHSGMQLKQTLFNALLSEASSVVKLQRPRSLPLTCAQSLFGYFVFNTFDIKKENPETVINFAKQKFICAKVPKIKKRKGRGYQLCPSSSIIACQLPLGKQMAIYLFQIHFSRGSLR